MQKMISALSIERNVAPNMLEYCGVMDESKTIGKILYMFHIQDEAHPNFKSTICYLVRV